MSADRRTGADPGPRQAEIVDAFARLGLGAPRRLSRGQVRQAFRDMVRRTHPDLAPGPTAAEATRLVTAAYRTVLDALDTLDDPWPVEPPPATPQAAQPATQQATQSATVPAPVTITDLGDGTLALGAPAGVTLRWVLDAAHRLGEVAYLDPGAGLLEVVIEFVEAPVCSVVMTLQRRDAGMTEVTIHVEAIGLGDAPPAAAVAALIATTMLNDTTMRAGDNGTVGRS